MVFPLPEGFWGFKHPRWCSFHPAEEPAQLCHQDQRLVAAADFRWPCSKGGRYGTESSEGGGVKYGRNVGLEFRIDIIEMNRNDVISEISWDLSVG